MQNPLDVELQDPELDEEIELLGEVMVLAAGSEQPLDRRAVDTVLGIRG